MSVWDDMDAAARPHVKAELYRLGWELHGEGGSHQWTAWRHSPEFGEAWTIYHTSVTAMNPFVLVERVIAHERKLRLRRERRADLDG